MLNLNKEPALIVGTIVAAIIAFLQTFVGDGILQQDAVDSASNLLTALSPIIAGALIRFKAYAPETVAKITGKPVDSLPPPP